MNNQKFTLTVSSSPHIRENHSTASIMQNVVVALLPALAVAGYVFGMRTLMIVALCVVSSVLTEAVIQKLMKKPVTVGDWSAVVTGLLLALNLPINATWWMCVIGSVFVSGIAVALAGIKLIFRAFVAIPFSASGTLVIGGMGIFAIGCSILIILLGIWLIRIFKNWIPHFVQKAAKIRRGKNNEEKQ